MASSQCLAKRGHLTTIESPDMNAALASRFGNSSFFWIGYKRTILSDDTWAWQDGSVSGYNNWATGKPNCVQGKKVCAAINWGSSGGWHDWECDTNLFHGICSYHPLPDLEQGE